MTRQVIVVTRADPVRYRAPIDDVTAPPLRRGVWIFPVDPAADLLDAVVRADEAGLDEVWIADEGVSRDPMIVLAAAARATSRVRLGVGITSPMLRHPGALAASISTLDELSGGRAVLGLGVGGELSLDPFGLTVERRVGMLRDAVRTVHDVLRGTGSERYRPPAHASPPRPVPVFIGSRGEQTLRLASGEADGAFFSGLTDELLDDAFAWARSERAIDVALYKSVRFRDGAEESPSFMAGSPAEVAPRLRALADHYRPASIGIALVDGDPVGVMLDRAIETFAAMAALDNP